MDPQVVALIAAAGLVLFAVAVAYAAVKLGHRWAGLTDRSPDDVTELVADLVGGKVRWPEQAT